MKKRDFRFLIYAVVFVFILQVGILVFTQIQIKNINSSIESQNKILSDYFTNTDSKIKFINSNINSISSNILTIENSLESTRASLEDTQKSLESEISKIKASTSSDFSGIIENAVQSVVSIKTNVAQGTGFIISSDGYVITNAHVLEGASYVVAITAEQDQKPIELIGYSDNLDLALLKISGNYDYLTFADSEDVKVGSKVIAIGNPYGLSFSVTEGIVSAVHREVSGEGGEYIQTDAALNAGNSGGPLINTGGDVVGINNFKVEGDNIGLSLESYFIVEGVNKISMRELNESIIN